MGASSVTVMIPHKRWQIKQGADVQTETAKGRFRRGGRGRPHYRPVGQASPEHSSHPRNQKATLPRVAQCVYLSG